MDNVQADGQFFRNSITLPRLMPFAPVVVRARLEFAIFVDRKSHRGWGPRAVSFRAAHADLGFGEMITELMKLTSQSPQVRFIVRPVAKNAIEKCRILE